MKPHILNLSDLEQWIEEPQRYLYASNGKGKRLYFTTKNTFEIDVDGKKVYETNHADNAINKYNKL